jgi:hypothetical protein
MVMHLFKSFLIILIMLLVASFSYSDENEGQKFAIQVGGRFMKKKNAENLEARLKKKGYEAYVYQMPISNTLNWYWVRVGLFEDRELALHELSQFKKDENMDAALAVISENKINKDYLLNKQLSGTNSREPSSGPALLNYSIKAPGTGPGGEIRISDVPDTGPQDSLNGFDSEEYEDGPDTGPPSDANNDDE